MVLGDHGQTMEGDHGGGGAEETTSLLAVIDVSGAAAAAESATDVQAAKARASGACGSDASGADDWKSGAASAAPADCTTTSEAAALPASEYLPFMVEAYRHTAARKAAAAVVVAAANSSSSSSSVSSIEEQQRRPAGNCCRRLLCCRAIPQVDFAPTLSLLLGLPPPYSSIGKVDPGVWGLLLPRHASSGSQGVCSRGAGNDKSTAADQPNSQTVSSEASGGGSSAALVDWLHGYVDALRCNALQVSRYLAAYSRQRAAAASGQLPAQALAESVKLLDNAESAMHAARGGISNSTVSAADEAADRLAAAASAYLRYLEASSRLARHAFGRLDYKRMALGCALLLAALALQLATIWCVRANAPAARRRRRHWLLGILSQPRVLPHHRTKLFITHCWCLLYLPHRTMQAASHGDRSSLPPLTLQLRHSGCGEGDKQHQPPDYETWLYQQPLQHGSLSRGDFRPWGIAVQRWSDAA